MVELVLRLKYMIQEDIHEEEQKDFSGAGNRLDLVRWMVWMTKRGDLRPGLWRLAH
jgi:hypothetical protein